MQTAGHEVVIAARSTGVNSYTGEGLADALAGAAVLVDVSNSSYTDAVRSGVVRVVDVLVQPMAADEVADAVAQAALGVPLYSTVEFGGPEVFTLDELAVLDLRYRQDEREVVPDPLGTYFGARLTRRDLLPEATATIAPTRYHDWRVRTSSTVTPEGAPLS